MTTWDRNARPAASLLDALGSTPLVRLARVAPDLELFAKVEWYGPTGSVKDRIYAHMLSKAEEAGRLKPGMTIIECTTGNAGIACSAVAVRRGSTTINCPPARRCSSKYCMIGGIVSLTFAPTSRMASAMAMSDTGKGRPRSSPNARSPAAAADDMQKRPL